MNDNNIGKNLYIPQGLVRDNEWISGFGKNELIQSTIIFLITMAFNFLFFLIKRSTIVLIISILLSVTGSIMLTQKDQSNVSVYDQIKFLIKFSKSQKYYPYKSLPEWGEKREN